MVRRPTFQERVDVVKFAAAHGRAAAVRRFGVAETQVNALLAFETAGRRELCDPACKQPGITGDLLRKVLLTWRTMACRFWSSAPNTASRTPAASAPS